ncbi:MAG TPA: hypothetical protein VGH98_20120 [Gemmatimonadaceae bacterium]
MSCGPAENGQALRSLAFDDYSVVDVHVQSLPRNVRRQGLRRKTSGVRGKNANDGSAQPAGQGKGRPLPHQAPTNACTLNGLE